MASFEASVLTEAGLRLTAKVQAGLTKLAFTKAAAGDGDYEEGESPVGLTALKSLQQEFPINRVDVVNDHTIYLKFVITNCSDNIGLTAGYYVKEVGIFANDPDDGEILYAVAIAVRDQWDYLPAYNSMYPASIYMEFYTEVGNAKEVSILAKNNIYASQEDLEALQGLIADLRKEIDRVGQSQIGWEYVEESETLVYVQGTSGSGIVGYDADTELLYMTGFAASLDAVAERAAAIVEGNIQQISKEDALGYFEP